MTGAYEGARRLSKCTFSRPWTLLFFFMYLANRSFFTFSQAEYCERCIYWLSGFGNAASLDKCGLMLIFLVLRWVLQDFPWLSPRFLSVGRIIRSWLRVKSRTNALERFLTYSARKSIMPSSLRKRIIQQTDNIDFYPFLQHNLSMAVWVESFSLGNCNVCIYVCTL